MDNCEYIYYMIDTYLTEKPTLYPMCKLMKVDKSECKYKGKFCKYKNMADYGRVKGKTDPKKWIPF